MHSYSLQNLIFIIMSTLEIITYWPKKEQKRVHCTNAVQLENLLFVKLYLGKKVLFFMWLHTCLNKQQKTLKHFSIFHKCQCTYHSGGGNKKYSAIETGSKDQIV